MQQQEQALQSPALVWTPAMIAAKLSSGNPVWIYRSLLALFKRQTTNEQTQQTTDDLNGVGFNAFDADILTSFAKFYQNRGYLSDKQRAIAQRRLLKYSAQLAKIANKEI